MRSIKVSHIYLYRTMAHFVQNSNEDPTCDRGDFQQSTTFLLNGIKLAIKIYQGKVWLHFNNRFCFEERISLSLYEFLSIFVNINAIKQSEIEVINKDQELKCIEITKFFMIKILKCDEKILYIFEKKPYKKQTSSNSNQILQLNLSQFQELINEKDEILKFTQYLENKIQTKNREQLYKNISNQYE